MRKIVILSIVFACSFLYSFAQQKQISGRVLDERDSTPVAGATVKELNGKAVTITDDNGNFTLSVSAATNELIISFVGYTSQTIPVSNQFITIALKPSEELLNEVVVIGYGTATKKDITGSVAKIGGEEVENFPAPSFESALQGKSAGVNIQSGSGKLGQGMKIRIRGASSISASSQPLYVVDGLPVISNSLSDDANDPTNPLMDINPNDIESVEILKDASAAAIYGARGGNGVILITTKKGRRNQKTSIELNTFAGISNPTKKREFADAREYVTLIEQAAVSDGTYDFNNDISGYGSLEEAIDDYKSFYEGEILDYYSLGTNWKKAEVNTDWQDQLFNKNAFNYQVNLSVTGGTDKTRFYISGFYTDQSAIVINNHFYRYGARVNIDHQVNDKLSLGINMTSSRSQLNRISNDDAFSTPGQLVAQLPISPVYIPGTNELNGETLYPNGLFDAQFNSDKQITYRTVGNVYVNYNFFPSLSFRSELGADIFNLNQESFYGKETIDGEGIGKDYLLFSQSTSLNTNNYFTFKPQLKNGHNINAVLGMSYMQNDLKKANSSGEQFPSDAIKNLSGATSITFANSDNYRYTFLSYFFRSNYSFADKYLLSFSVRTDGSSRFGSNKRYGWFPAVSGGWILSDESFLKNSSWLSFLKLRASYGLTGNAEIGESRFLTLYGVSNYPNLPGFIPLSRVGNPDLGWEKTAQTDIGLEFGLIKNRISGEIDVYKKHTTDLLVEVNLPATSGFINSYRNLGKMDNKGVEVTLSSKNFIGKFQWNTAINFAYNKNKVTDIQGQIIEGGFGLTQRAMEGQPIGVFYAQKFMGVDPQTGDALYLGEDGKPTSDFGEAARVPLGTSNPKWTGGFSNNFSYKGFDVNIFFTFAAGNKIYNAAGVFMSDGFYNGFDNQTVDILNAWKQPGDITNVPRIGYFYGSGYQNSSRWLYDGDYIRLKNVSISYTLPATAMRFFHISSARVYITGVNLLTITNYDSDPEIDTETLDNIGGGQDFYTIPQPKTFTLGLDIKF